jgi:hypothetical protein
MKTKKPKALKVENEARNIYTQRIVRKHKFMK